MSQPGMPIRISASAPHLPGPPEPATRLRTLPPHIGTHPAPRRGVDARWRGQPADRVVICGADARDEATPEQIDLQIGLSGPDRARKANPEVDLSGHDSSGAFTLGERLVALAVRAGQGHRVSVDRHDEASGHRSIDLLGNEREHAGSGPPRWSAWRARARRGRPRSSSSPAASCGTGGRGRSARHTTEPPRTPGWAETWFPEGKRSARRPPDRPPPPRPTQSRPRTRRWPRHRRTYGRSPPPGRSRR